jgi:hypothetical protein
MRSICFFILLAACAADGGPTDDGEDGPAFQEARDLGAVGACVIAANVMTSGGCAVEFVCEEAGVLALSCTPGDGGLACACAIGSSMIEVSAPVDACGDPTAAARAVCGWSFL